MKLLAVLALAATFSSAFASEKFGGVRFDPTVEAPYVSSLKNDLRYLYTAPLVEADAEFLSVAQLNVGDGQNMHNWVLNRVQHIVGERYDLDSNITYSLLRAIWFRFPNTPLPDIFNSMASVNTEEEPQVEIPKIPQTEEPKVRTVMSNIGTVVYLIGKKSKVPFGLKSDEGVIYAKTPRVGVLQVGEGLFFEKFLHNKDVNASANSVSRLGTLFHEARHSDGNSKHTGFLHATCPTGHAYATYAACEAVGNGPYTIGGLAERHMIKSCKTCSTKELTSLTTKVADAFSRVVVENNNAVKIKSNEQLIEMYGKLIATYYELMVITKDEQNKKTYVDAIESLKVTIANLQAENKRLKALGEVKPAMLDATPEGEVKIISLKDSSAIMKKSLAK